MKDDLIRSAVLDAMIAAVEAQLRTLRRLRSGETPAKPVRKRRSKLDIVEDILREADAPLHIADIIRRARSGQGVELDRESIVSSLTKQVNRSRRFCRTAPNTFGLIEERP